MLVRCPSHRLGRDEQRGGHLLRLQALAPTSSATRPSVGVRSPRRAPAPADPARAPCAPAQPRCRLRPIRFEASRAPPRARLARHALVPGAAVHCPVARAAPGRVRAGIGDLPAQLDRALQLRQRRLARRRARPAAVRGSVPRPPAPTAGSRCAVACPRTSRAARRRHRGRQGAISASIWSGHHTRRAGLDDLLAVRRNSTSGPSAAAASAACPTDSSASPSAPRAKCSAGRPLVCSASSSARPAALACRLRLARAGVRGAPVARADRRTAWPGRPARPARSPRRRG